MLAIWPLDELFKEPFPMQCYYIGPDSRCPKETTSIPSQRVSRRLCQRAGARSVGVGYCEVPIHALATDAFHTNRLMHVPIIRFGYSQIRILSGSAIDA